MPVKGGGLQGVGECLAAIELVGVKARTALRPAVSELGAVCSERVPVVVALARLELPESPAELVARTRK